MHKYKTIGVYKGLEKHFGIYPFELVGTGK